MKVKLTFSLILTIGLLAANASATLNDLPPLPSHEEFLKELVRDGRMTAEEAGADLELAAQNRIESKKRMTNLPTSTADHSPSQHTTVSEPATVGTVFTPRPAERKKVAGTNRGLVSTTPIYKLHDGEYMIPLIPQIILNGVITKNGYHYMVSGVQENFFKLVFKKKYAINEIRGVLETERHPFLIK